jgi:tetratricopeptide (TPR) repeat protein
MKKYIPDDLSSGSLYFFLGQTQLHSEQFEGAKNSFEACFGTHWIDTSHNRFLVTFAKAKTLQSLQDYVDSIDCFATALQLQPDDPYCHFRRAWSYKVLHLINFVVFSFYFFGLL